MGEVNYLMKHIPEKVPVAHHHLRPDDLWVEGMRALHPDPYQRPHPWTIWLLPAPPPQVGIHSFEGINPLCPPLPGKAIKLFFSTSPKTLSPRFNSVSGSRGRIRLQVLIVRESSLTNPVFPLVHSSQSPFHVAGVGGGGQPIPTMKAGFSQPASHLDPVSVSTTSAFHVNLLHYHYQPLQ